MDELFESLSPLEKLQQRFIFGTNTENIEIIETLIRDYHIGGVILYKKNYKSYDDMLNVIRRLKFANRNNKVPLFIAIDQEGGKVNRMPEEIHRLRNIYDVTEKNELLVNDYAKIIAKMLKETGINMNFAPVLDIYNNSNSKAVYKRCFYGDEESVIKLGERYLTEFNKEGVISVIKHFPGHGITRLDSHGFTPFVYNYKEVLKIHIRPFDKLLEKSDAVMMGHIVVRKLTSFLPASISDKFIQKYLREKEKFKGLIITDEINMLKRNPLYRFIFKKKALQSSNDLLLIKVSSVKEGYKFIKKCKKLCDMEKLNESTKRILLMKEKYNVNDNVENLGTDIDKINEMIDKINRNLE